MDASRLQELSMLVVCTMLSDLRKDLLVFGLKAVVGCCKVVVGLFQMAVRSLQLAFCRLQMVVGYDKILAHHCG